MNMSTVRTTEDAPSTPGRANDRAAPAKGGAACPVRAASGCPIANRDGELPPIAYDPEPGVSAPTFREAALAFETRGRPVYESTRSLYGTKLSEHPGLPPAQGQDPEPGAEAAVSPGVTSSPGVAASLATAGTSVASPEPTAGRADLPADRQDDATTAAAAPAAGPDEAGGPAASVHRSVATTEPAAALDPAPVAVHGFDQMPRQRSLPLIGNSLRYLRDAGALLRGLHATHGEVVRYDNFGHHWIGLHGADANQLVFREARDAFSSDAWGLFLNGLFDRGLMLIDGEAHHHQRGLLQRAFSTKAMAAYLGIIQGAALTALEQWPQGRAIRVHPRLKRMTLDIAIEVFTGLSPGKETQRVAEAFMAMCRAATAIGRLPIPGSRWRAGLRGRRELDAWFRELLRMRREVPGKDLLSNLCEPESSGDAPIPDDAIVDQMIFLLMAAHDTTTSALTNLLYQLGRDGHWRRKLRRRSEALVNPFPDQTALNGLVEMDWAVKESLRMLPPLPVMARRTTREVTFKQWRIPAGRLVALSPWATHYDPERWTEPERFDPARFSPERAEHKHHPFQWIPFGGGAHQCIGMQFGMMEIKAILHLLLTQIDWAVPKDYVMPLDFTNIPTPKDGLPVALRKLG